MKALSTLKSAINLSSFFGIIALVMLVPVIFPHFALAAELQTSSQALVFDIKDFSKIETKNLLTLEDISAEDPLVKNLKTYLQKYGSPLDVYAADIIQQPRWDDALAISFVESNMGKYCFDNNCSGIGVKPGHPSWRKYKSKLDWFKDLSVLLQKPIYSEKYTTFRKMKGVYVQPGSENWVRGAEKIKSELTAIQEKSEQERLALMDHYQLALAQ
jgi:hypothetical protein